MCRALHFLLFFLAVKTSPFQSSSFALTMKFLPLALLLCALLPHCWAACAYFDSLKVLTHCQDIVDKTWHPIGSKWRNSACRDCTCDSCCDAYSTPVNFPDDCMKEFDPVNCKYKVFKKNDRNQECPVFGAVGK